MAIVVRATRCPKPISSPWILLQPQLEFPVAILTMSRGPQVLASKAVTTRPSFWTGRVLQIDSVVTARQSPWQNGYCERVVGSIRRECTDHVIPLGERHLTRLVLEYQDFYNRSRTHLALAGNSPVERHVEHAGLLVSEPVLGGLHHRYRRAA